MKRRELEEPLVSLDAGELLGMNQVAIGDASTSRAALSRLLSKIGEKPPPPPGPPKPPPPPKAAPDVAR